jgi:type I restriction enzyme S subunit
MADGMNGGGELPLGWTLATVGDVAEYVNRGKAPSYTDSSGVPIINQRCVRWSGVNFQHLKFTTVESFDKTDARQRLRNGDVLWNSTGTGTIGRAAVFQSADEYPNITVDTHVTIIRPSIYHPVLLRHWIFSDFIQKKLDRLQAGSTNQVELSRAAVLGAGIPMPPLAEQHRIVAKIDELFGEIEAGEQELEKAREGLEAYRRAVLKAAVTGELTREWREKNAPNETGADLLDRILAERRARDNSSKDSEPKPKFSRRKISANDAKSKDDETSDEQNRQDLPDGWVWTSIGQLFELFGGATPSRGDDSLWDGKIPWVSSGEVAFNRIRETRERITEAGLNSCSTRVHPAGTILLAMIGEGRTRGQAAILDIPACNNQNAAAIRVSATPIPPEYVFYVLLYFYEKTRSLGQGGNQPALNQKIVRAMSLPLPSLVELEEIVGSIGHEMSRVDDAQHILDMAVTSANALRQSILAAAFSGKLVPQDQADEPASVLLERLRAEKTVVPAPRRGARTTRATRRRQAPSVAEESAP